MILFFTSFERNVHADGSFSIHSSGAYSGGGGAHPARAPTPPKIEKKMIFWRKIVIFHTKYLKNVRASLDN